MIRIFKVFESKVKNMDWDKWLKNTAVFAAPLLLVFLVAIQAGTPIKEALFAVYLYALNLTIDLIKKFIAANPAK